MIRFFVERRVACTMTFAALFLAGAVSLPRLKVSLFPDIVYPRLVILTPYGSTPAEEMETLVTVPVEDAAGSASGVKRISSRSEEGLSIVEVSFDWGTNLDLAVIQVRQKVDLVQGVLPQDCGRPLILKHDPSAAPVIVLAARPQSLKFEETRDYIEKNIRPLLERVDGAASVSIRGGMRREIQVEADLARLKAHGIGLLELRDTIAASNFNFPAGNVRKDDRELAVRVSGELTGPEDLSLLAAGRAPNGSTLKLSELARISDTHRDRTGAAFYNGEPAVLVLIRKEPGKNTVETAALLKNAVEDINRRFQTYVAFTVVQDNSTHIVRAIDDVQSSALIGALISFLVVFAFLRSLKSALIINTSVPAAVFASFALMYAQGVSINVMSLGGLAMGVGMVVDNSIVVLEAIEQVREEKPHLSLMESSIEGTRMVVSSVIASTGTSILVFLPVVFVSGIAGAVFRDLALAVTYSLVSSLVCAFTLVPMLCAIPAGPRFAKIEAFLSKHLAGLFALADRSLAFLKSSILKLLELAFQEPRKALSAAGVLTAAGLLLFLPLEKTLFPRADSGRIAAELTLPPGTTLEEASAFQLRFQDFLFKNALANHALALVGREEDDLSSLTAGVKKPAYSFHELDVSGRSSAGSFVERTRAALLTAGNVEHSLQIKGDVMEDLLGREESAFVLQVQSETRRHAREQALKLLEHARGLGLSASSTAEAGEPEVRLILDRTKASSAGLSAEQAAAIVRLAYQGEIATVIHQGDREVPVRLRLREEDRKRPESVRALFIPVENGKLLELGSILTPQEGRSTASVLRENQRRIEQIRVQNADEAQRKALLETARRLEGVTARAVTANEETLDSLRSLGFAFLLSIVLIYQLLASQFESFLHPLSLALSIPLMFAGVSISLFVTGHGLNITSAMGMIMLVGIVCNASVILYEYIEQNRGELGHEIEKLPGIIARSVEHRVRPILLTTLTTILGLLPLAWPSGSGGDVQAPLAVAVIGGLTVSTLLTMVLFPLVFFLIERRRA